MGTIRRFDLQEIKDKYNSKVFVETGTMYGDGVDYALQYNFDKIISIEIEPSIHKTAVKKYNNNNNVDIVLGDSSKAVKVLNWEPEVDFDSLAKMMYEEDYNDLSNRT